MKNQTRHSPAIDLRDPADLRLWLQERNGLDLLESKPASLPRSVSDETQGQGYDAQHFFSSDDE